MNQLPVLSNVWMIRQTAQHIDRAGGNVIFFPLFGEQRPGIRFRQSSPGFIFVKRTL
jgi:hypothetical protein